MPRRSTRKTKAFHWIPPPAMARPKIIVTRSDGTTEDNITDTAVEWEFEDGKTDVIGRFECKLWNNREQWTDIWTGMESVEMYCDYAAAATNKRFKGYIEKVKYHNNMITITGRSNGQVLVDKLVTYQASTKECSLILKAIIDLVNAGVTYTNIKASTKSITVNWYEKPFLDCVKELCDSAGFDAYLDYDDDYHFFEVGTVVNNGEGIVHTYNMISIDEFADDITFVKNKVVVYGAVIDGIQIIKSAKDADSISTYNERKMIVNDDNITDETQAQEYADYLLAKNKDPPQIGEMTSFMLATIQPGENINLSAPTNNVSPGNYQILSYKHKFDTSKGFITTVKVNKEPRRFSHIISSLINANNQKNQTSSNPYAQENTYNFYFNSDSGTHSTTEITDGVLKPTGASGTWISTNRELDTNLYSVSVVIVGETLTGAKIYVSGNNGLGWEEVANKNYLKISSALGAGLKVKVVFSSADTQVNSLSIQYKET